MIRRLADALLNVAIAFTLLVGVAYAQSGQVIFLGAVPGTTKAINCGTPTTPSVCVVGDGVWIWQSAATGWFLVQVGATGPQGPAGPVGPQGPPGSPATTFSAITCPSPGCTVK